VTGELHYDAVVIGAGTAGLVAAARLAEGGARVCVLAKGVGSTHIAPATIDVLGYAPDRVASPSGAMPDFVSSHPEHPYAALGIDSVAEAARWFHARVESGPLPGYRYVGDVDRNYLLPSAVGALRPSAIVPETMAAGDSVAFDRACVVGTRVLRDFHAALCASNLSRLGIPAR
jgi:glycerol-3-phosphate dehydrogenase subunit B